LPKQVTVRDFLDRYREQCKDVEPDVLDEVVAGIKLYFNRTLGTLLLYRLERPQYQRVFHENAGKEMIDIYGAEHLLRLFGRFFFFTNFGIVQLPSLIAHTNMDKDSVLLLRESLQDVLKYMALHKPQFFSPYVNASPADLAQMKG
jgi:mortality factor 4-like protein 1